MGYAIAQAAVEMGAEVLLVSGPTALTKPQGAQVVNVTSAAEMFEAVKQQVANADMFIGVAAVADYRVAQPSEQKIKKSDAVLTLELIPNPDILAYVASLPKPPFCVGCASKPRPNARRRTFRCLPPIWRRTRSAATTMNWCCSTLQVSMCCRAPINSFWHGRCCATPRLFTRKEASNEKSGREGAGPPLA
jgi:hypothetical protein